MYSIGSSMVRMCSGRFRLIQPTIAARVVDLPDPVGPVMSTRPWGRLSSGPVDVGRPMSSGVGISVGMSRRASAGRSSWKKALARKRAVSAQVNAKSSWRSREISSLSSAVIREAKTWSMKSLVISGDSGMEISSPSMRTRAWVPAARCRSVAPCSQRYWRYGSRPAVSGPCTVSSPGSVESVENDKWAGPESRPRPSVSLPDQTTVCSRPAGADGVRRPCR